MHINHPVARAVIIILAAGMATSIFFTVDSFFGFAPFGSTGYYGYTGFGSLPYFTVYIIAIVIVGVVDLITRREEKNPQLAYMRR